MYQKLHKISSYNRKDKFKNYEVTGLWIFSSYNLNFHNINFRHTTKLK